MRNRRNRALFTGQKTKFRLPLKLSLLRGSRSKSARASPQQCAHSAPDFTQIGSLSAELGAYSQTREHSFCAVEYFHYICSLSL